MTVINKNNKQLLKKKKLLKGEKIADENLEHLTKRGTDMSKF